MRATYMYGAGDVRVIDIPDPVVQPTDAVVHVVRACVCGSDLHPFHSMPADEAGTPMGHEFFGVVEAVGSEVATPRAGVFVIAPFAWSCGRCEFCRAGLQTSCVIGGFWAGGGIGGGQAEAVRVPLADGTLVKVAGIDAGTDEGVLAGLLTLSDVYGTGWHAAVRGGVRDGSTVTVIGDGAVGLLAVLSARQLGAERIVLMGRHRARTDLGRAFGATDVVAERGEEGITAVRDLTDGGSPIVLEAVGHMPAYEQAVGIVRPGGVISRVGVPQYDDAPVGFGSLFGHNITLTGGPPRFARTSSACSRRPRRHGRARARVRSHLRSRGHPEGLRSDGRAHRPQGRGPAVTITSAPGDATRREPIHEDAAAADLDGTFRLVQRTRPESGASVNDDEQAPGGSSPMGTWTEEELARIGAADELYVSTRRPDGTLRSGIPIWQVRVGDAIYIRSAYGPENGWFKRAKRTRLGRIRSGGVEKDVTFEPTTEQSDAITAAYHAKYDRYGPGLVRTVTGVDVLETTLRVMPVSARRAGGGSAVGTRR